MFKINKNSHTRKGEKIMNYKKFTNNAYNLHIINTNKFKTIMVKINFKNKIKKQDITYRNLLGKILFQANENFKTKRELEIFTEELYNLNIGCKNYISGNYIITSFNCVFLNEKYTEENMNNKSLDFLFDIIFKPSIENKEFYYFDLVKRLVKDEIDTLKDDPNRYSTQRLFQNMDKNSILSYNSIGYMDDLESITNKDLYKYYQKMLKSNLIDIFIIGDIDSDEMKNEILKKFPINTIKKPSESHFYEHEKIRRPKTVKENLDVQQSKLRMGYKLTNLTDFERKYVANIYSFILGGGPDSKLFKNVREKNSLCYSVNSSFLPIFNTMIISAGINKEDFKKCVSLIKKEVTKLSKGDFKEEDIDAAKTTYLNSLKEIEDSQSSILRIFESYEYLNFDLLEDRTSIINVTKEDIINFSKKIHLDTIYVLEGEEDEEA